MKLGANSNAENIVSTELSQNKFNIIANEKMFSILSSKIYKDKIAAPVRELSCNAYDAHVAAGKKNVPFRIHIPTYSESYFEIQDYGNGLDADTIENLYTTYGYSSKADSNDFVGCLGLGSKSPFAYTDKFDLTSVHNGKKLYYCCFMEKGCPNITKMGEIPTTDPSGVTVKFMVDMYDINSFKDRVVNLFSFWEIKPKTNIELEYKKYEFEEGVCFNPNKNQYWNREQSVLMGGVAYKVSIMDVEPPKNASSGDIDLFNAISSHSVIIEAPIGAVDITVSREDLEMTEKTVEFLFKKLVKYSKNILSNFKATRKDYDSDFKWLIAYHDFLNKHSFIGKADFGSQEKALDDKYNNVFKDGFSVTTVSINPRSSNKNIVKGRPRYFSFCVSSHDSLEVKYVYFSSPNQMKCDPHMKLWLNDTKDTDKGSRILVFFSEARFKGALEKEKVEVYNKEWFKEHYPIEREKRVKGATTSEWTGIRGLYRNWNYGSYNRNGIDYRPMLMQTLSDNDKTLFNDQTATVIYFKSAEGKVGFTAELEKCVPSSYAPVLLTKFCEEPKNKTIIVALSEKRIEEFKKNKRFVSAESWLNKHYGSNSKACKNIQQFVDVTYAKSYFGLTLINTEALNDPCFVKAIKCAKQAIPTLSEEERCMKNNGHYEPSEDVRKDKALGKLYERYPMLRFVVNIGDCMSEDTIKDINDYIALIEAQSTLEDAANA